MKQVTEFVLHECKEIKLIILLRSMLANMSNILEYENGTFWLRDIGQKAMLKPNTSTRIWTWYVNWTEQMCVHTIEAKE